MLGATDDRSSLLAALADACGATGFTALGDATVLATSHGPLTTHAGLNTRTGRAERGGPLCQRIFGAVVDHSCLCTKYRGHEHLGHRCEKCGVVVGPASVRGERFGHVALVVALRHPWLADARVRSCSCSRRACACSRASAATSPTIPTSNAASSSRSMRATWPCRCC